jgi:hypothetical protein
VFACKTRSPKTCSLDRLQNEIAGCALILQLLYALEQWFDQFEENLWPERRAGCGDDFRNAALSFSFGILGLSLTSLIRFNSPCFLSRRILY